MTIPFGPWPTRPQWTQPTILLPPPSSSRTRLPNPNEVALGEDDARFQSNRITFVLMKDEDAWLFGWTDGPRTSWQSYRSRAIAYDEFREAVMAELEVELR